MSAYIKLFGDEVKYMEITQESIKQIGQDIADLLLGKIAKIEYANGGKKLSLLTFLHHQCISHCAAEKEKLR